MFAEAKIISGVSTKSSISITGLDNIWDCAVADNLPEDTKHFYDLWANNYEEDMRSMQYRAPEILAEYIINTLRIDRNAKILDAGCGTGLLGEELRKRGFTHMDGVDCSHCMLDLALPKAVYRKTEVVHVLPSMTEPPIHVDYRYECIALCDAFQPGHITPGCLPKLAAMLTDKGVIAFCHRKLSSDNLRKSVFGPADFAAAVAASGVTLKESKDVEGYRRMPPTKGQLGYFAK
ncbi:methyltransferase-like protein 27 isoform X2 [Varroa jacobsoni]|nr:methyltransferase-like protein 27 isoform X2 [Varroa jacobsoni]XP_022710359.1 methyltransferase-like protein 27 isoform X2 [Varroa jacobsoni]